MQSFLSWCDLNLASVLCLKLKLSDINALNSLTWMQPAELYVC